MEPIAWFIDNEEYKASSDSYGDIFVIKAPYFTVAQFCSPCAPGACYLENPIDINPVSDSPPKRIDIASRQYLANACYCFGHDWFDDAKAPYPVYSVETGELVNPTE
jgi:hypothetical protein